MRNEYGVADGARTHDNQNHNLALYQLNYGHHNNSVDFIVLGPFLVNRLKRFLVKKGEIITFGDLTLTVGVLIFLEVYCPKIWFLIARIWRVL